MAASSKVIRSMDDLMASVPRIIEAVNANPELGLRFLANPLLLAEELGYSLSDDMRQFAARRVRYSTPTYQRLVALEKDVWERVGDQFDLDSPDELDRVLFTRLKLDRPDKIARKSHRKKGQTDESAREESARSYGQDKPDDPLEVLRGKHPIMEPLLEYRKLEASTPRLASREIYQRIVNEKIDVPVGQIKLHLKIPPKQ